MRQLRLDLPVILDTPTGMQTVVQRAAHPVNRPPLTIQRGPAWHYTSLGALRSILQGRELWATSWRATNDRTEFRHGVDFLRQAWTNIESDLDDRTRELLESAGPSDSYVDYFEHVNILYASRERDSPYQWNSYASGPQGIAKGLDLGTSLLTDVDDRPRQDGANLFGMQWLKVIYTARQKELAAARFVSEMNEAIRKETAMDLPSFMALNVLTALNFKHQGFHHEKEARCVSLSSGVTLKVMPNDEAKTIVPWKGSPVRANTGHQPLPIREILIGPRATASTVEAVSRFLADADITNDLIGQSDLPFR